MIVFGLTPESLEQRPPMWKGPRATELDCQQAIVDAAKAAGWLVHAGRAAQGRGGKWSTPIQGHAGFPDLVLVHERWRQLVLVELKRRPNNVEPEQLRWIGALRTLGVDVCVWWVPEQLDKALAFITRRPA